MNKNTQQKKSKKHSEKNTSLKAGSYVILGIVIIAFIGAPLVSIGLRGNIDDFTFGRYGNKKIIYKADSYFAQSVRSSTENLEQQLGQKNLDNTFLRYVWKSAFDDTVIHYALLENAKNASYKTSKTKINTSILELPFLQKNDAFDVKLYNSLTVEQKKSLNENQTNMEIAFNVYKDLISLVSVSEKEKQFFKQINSQTRSFKFVRVEKNKIEDTKFITDYGKNKEEEFVSYAIKSITLDTKKEAENVLNKITAEEISFEEAAKTYSVDAFKEQEGVRENLFAYQISQQEGDKVLDIIKNINKITEISPVVETLTGNFAFYQLSAQAVNPNFADEKIQSTVKNYLLANDPNIIENQKKELLENFIATTTIQNFETKAKTLGLESGTTNKFPINVGNILVLTKLESEDSLDISALVSETEILSKLFSLKQDEYSKPHVIGTYIYVFLVSSINNNDKKSQDTYKDDDTLLSFIKQTQEDSLRTAIVIDEKLTDNFDTAYNTIYPASTDANTSQNQ